jgi:hypothetical protein
MKPELQRKIALVIALSLLFVAGGGVLIGLGVLTHQENEAFRASAWAADGVVTSFYYEEDPAGDPAGGTYFAVVSFELEGGEEIQFRGPAREGIIDMRLGDPVRVLYNPADPTLARVDSFMGMWFAPMMFWMVGAGAMLIPLLTIWETWKWAEQHSGRRLPEINRLPWNR